MKMVMVQYSQKGRLKALKSVHSDVALECRERSRMIRQIINEVCQVSGPVTCSWPSRRFCVSCTTEIIEHLIFVPFAAPRLRGVTTILTELFIPRSMPAPHAACFACVNFLFIYDLRRRRRLCFWCGLFVCLSVCPSDYSQTCERILSKFFGWVGHDSRTK